MSRLSPALRAPVLVTLLAATIYLPFAGSFGLLDPWETHYGEVARNMVESGDWISPWWGSYWPQGAPCSRNSDCAEGEVCEAIRAEFLQRPSSCRPREIRREGTYFFSKPVLSMWMMALGMVSMGVNPWGMRLLFVLLSLYAIFTLTYALRRFFGERVAVLSGVVVATSPFYAILARQAVTDMPFVALMTAGMAHLMLAVFDDPERSEAPAPGAFRGLLVVALLLLVPQLVAVFDLRVSFRLFGARLMAGPVHVVVYSLAILWFWRSARRDVCQRQVHMYCFYLLVGLATLAKGLLGFALPGAVILLYLVDAWDWRQLRRVELIRGPILAACVGVPWYGAMFARHFRGFWERFFVHDHFKRLASGVHQIDTGAFDHYILWLALGMFPWAALIPAAIGRTLVRSRSGRSEHGQGPVELFVALWFLLVFTLFTLSSTKFHHYIFPIVPAAAVLIALLLDELLDSPARRVWLVMISTLGLYALVAWALSADPQRIVNTFTYMYDREWPPELDYRRFLQRLGWLGALPFALWGAAALRPEWLRGRWRRLPLCALVVFAVVFSTWLVDRYLPGISPTWSQRGLSAAYYEACEPVTPGLTTLSGRPVCRQSLVAYKMNWRGETFHSDNTVVPLRNDKDLDHFLTTDQGRQEFFALVETTRLNSQLKAHLPKARRDLVKRVHERNSKFVLVRVPVGD